MKRLIGCIFAILVLIFSVSCTTLIKGNVMESSNIKFIMIAEILEVDDKILVDVKESQYAFGEYLLITHENTIFLNCSGETINKSELKKGDIIEVYYNGQVMLSLPPQVVAHKIKLK